MLKAFLRQPGFLTPSQTQTQSADRTKTKTNETKEEHLIDPPDNLFALSARGQVAIQKEFCDNVFTTLCLIEKRHQTSYIALLRVSMKEICSMESGVFKGNVPCVVQ